MATALNEHLAAFAALVQRDSAGAQGEPPLLWHYTRTDALVDILTTKEVHLGSYIFMNDPAEGARSPKFAAECWEAAFDTVVAPLDLNLDLGYLRDAIRQQAADFGTPSESDSMDFVFSMTTLRDSLSQWARYGADGAGVALGLRVVPTEFPSWKGKGWSYGPFLCEIIYDWDDPRERPDDAAQKLAQIIDLAVKFIPKAESPTSVKNAAYMMADLLRPMLKHRGYHEEREWRIVARASKDSVDLYDVKASRFGLVPYVSIPLGQGIRLEQVVLGPKLIEANAVSARWLLRKHGSTAEVSRSELSYR